MKKEIAYSVVFCLILILIVGFFVRLHKNNLKGGYFQKQPDKTNTFSYFQGSVVINGLVFPFSEECEGTFNLIFQQHKKEKTLYGTEGVKKYLEMISEGITLMSPDSSHLLIFKDNLLYIISPLDSLSEKVPRLRAVCIKLPTPK